jgi:hypothetical protein
LGIEIDREHFDADAYSSFSARLEACLEALSRRVRPARLRPAGGHGADS